ncbi:MAG: hypothetical protein MJ003_05605 [Paludibacteraceae bacterium]|nr:hypothetical protein [Paludibacteraceae bacterium]
MNFTEFHNSWFEIGCFSIYQVRATIPGFDKNNIIRWAKKGYLIRLRQDWYTFSEYRQIPNASLYFAGKIYSPSYISLHTALNFYGLIPEAVTSVNSITTSRRTRYINDIGCFTYQSVKPELFFGYTPKTLPGGKTYMMATAEKALVDLLYLYPEYKTQEDMLELRLDYDYMHKELNLDLIHSYLNIINCKALTRRINILFKAYNL